MTTNYHTPIVNGDSRKNDAAIWNDPLGELDEQLATTHTIAAASSAEVATARGSYANLNSRLEALAISGGAGATATVASNTSTATVTVGTGQADAFSAGAPVVYIVDGVAEYGTIDTASGTSIVLDAAPSGQIDSGTLISQISQSEYEAASSVSQGGTFSPTLPRVLAVLEREVNVKAFGAFGDNSSHLVGSGDALTAAQAQYPLTDDEHTITAADEHDWCAIQEAILTASATGSSVERVYIPAGSYKVNRTLTVPMNSTDNGRTLRIEGAGHRATATSGTLITLTANTTLFLIPSQTTIRNMALIGNTYTNASSIGIRIGGVDGDDAPWDSTNSVQVVIDSVRFGNGWYRCISSLYECDQLSIIRCLSFSAVGQAVIYLSNDYFANSISPSANVVIDLCHFAYTASTTGGENLYGVYLLGTEASVIRNSVIRGYDHTIYLDGASGSRNYNLKIEGIHSEITQELKTATTNRWTPNTLYAVGDLIRPAPANANGWWYRCTTAGTSAANSIVNSSYEWTASARGTSEYYLELSGGGNPSITEPLAVMEDGTGMTFGFAGRLTAGQWGYGQNDSQGYNTIYVRLSDSTDPDTKATHYLWTSANEPTWPTTYGGTSAADGGAVWTAYKRSVFCEASSNSDSIANGLRISGSYCDNFAAFVYITTTINDTARVGVDNCTVRNCDMVYTTSTDVRAAFMAENSALDGSIRPYATLGAGNEQTSVWLRFVSRSGDLVGALGNASNGVSSWFTNESNANYASNLYLNDASETFDLINYSQITVNTGASTTAVVVYVPRITSNTWFNGLVGKQISIVHGTGSDSMSVGFNTSQTVLYSVSTTTITLADIGDAVTLRLVGVGVSQRWMIVGINGV